MSEMYNSSYKYSNVDIMESMMLVRIHWCVIVYSVCSYLYIHIEYLPFRTRRIKSLCCELTCPVQSLHLVAADLSTEIGFPRDIELFLFATASGLWIHLSLFMGTSSEMLIYVKYNLPSMCIYKPRKPLVTATWSVLRLPVKETACRCGE